jgi:hypothetical protein
MIAPVKLLLCYRRNNAFKSISDARHLELMGDSSKNNFPWAFEPLDLPRPSDPPLQLALKML